ncbi:cyclase family protein [Sneathiella sp.]|uniref:cyclase family protein n=1 Tax=Sneathiella sp. TaxID=1964365 RepID=UPI0026312061|nr:cyclase family protein [Sneathiella sp.]MDF2367562.1 cyclase family protein [Sneathiella sp.]
MSRWKNRPEGSNWGDFGENDQIGRLNLVTPEKIIAAAAEIRTGERFCLSLPLDLPGGNLLNPRRYPPKISPTVRSGDRPNMNYNLSQDNPNMIDVICDDLVVLHTQYSSQWDSLAHVGQEFDADGDGQAEIVYYNGYRGGEHIQGPEDEGGPRALALGIENMAAAGVQGRGVMIDLEGEFGRAQTIVGYDDLMRVMEKDNVTVEEGDMVCLHTGFAQMIMEMDGKPDKDRLHGSCAALNGRDPRLLNWITDSGLSLLIADNYAVEAHPSVPGEGSCAFLPIHEHCLFKLGIHLGELWYLTPLNSWLKSNNRSRFMLTAPPIRLPGAVGSPANPVATV